MALPALRSRASGVSVTPTQAGKPAGTTAGDLLVAWVVCNATNATLTPPAGWTRLRVDVTSASQGVLQAVFWKLAGSAEPANYSFSADTSSTLVVVVEAYSDPGSAAPISASGGALADPAAASVVAPSITGANGGLLVVGAAVGFPASSETFGTPTGMSAHGTVANGVSPWMASAVFDQVLATFGPTGTRTVTLSQQAKAVAATLVIGGSSAQAPASGGAAVLPAAEEGPFRQSQPSGERVRVRVAQLPLPTAQATEALKRDQQRVRADLANVGTGNVWVGEEGVDNASGQLLPPGAWPPMSFATHDRIDAYTDTSAVLHIVEHYIDSP